MLLCGMDISQCSKSCKPCFYEITYRGLPLFSTTNFQTFLVVFQISSLPLLQTLSSLTPFLLRKCCLSFCIFCFYLGMYTRLFLLFLLICDTATISLFIPNSFCCVNHQLSSIACFSHLSRFSYLDILLGERHTSDIHSSHGGFPGFLQ